MRTLNRSQALLGLLALCYGVASIAGAATVPEVKVWYQTLIHPSFAPPDGVFGPVWTLLYGMMAIAAWRAWRKDGFAWSSTALRLFLLQLGLSFVWSFLFFSFHLLIVSAVEILLLEGAILATTFVFFRRDRTAGLLMLPYVLWAGFASALNLAFASLN